MSPSWYDLLDVDPTASPEEIRAAWKSGIADLDPSDRKFRMLNQAAEVLLDRDRREAYDAELDRGGAGDDSPTAASVATPSKAPGAVQGSRYLPRALQRRRESRPDPLPAPAPETDQESESTERRTRPGWALIALGAAALILVVATVVALVRLDASPDGPTASSPAQEADGSDPLESARQVAEQAVAPVLSYDYRQLEEDAAAARSYMTEEYAAEYDQFFAAAVAENAPRTETVVQVQVIASGIVRSGEDRVDVLLFVNRPTTNSASPDPIIYKDQVTLQMRNVEGDWLVDGLVTSALAPE